MALILKYARWAGFFIVFLALGAAGACVKEAEPPEARSGEGRPDTWSGRRVKNDYALPSVVVFFDRVLDLSRPWIRERLETEFIIVVNQPAQVALWRRRALEYFPLIEAELKSEGLPADLKYMAVAESDLRPGVASPAGALGLWQFMPPAARRFGLTVNNRFDQRHLPERLLQAAKVYLKVLHAEFGDWPLVLAAYNAGEGRIRKALAEQGTRDYYELDLPRETERYVYRIAAIKIVLEDPGAYGFTAPLPEDVYQPLFPVRRMVTVPERSGWPELARAAGCDYKTLRIFNPHLRESVFAGTYEVRVPSE